MSKKQKINIYRTILTCSNDSLDQKNILTQRRNPKPSIIGINAPWSTKINKFHNQNQSKMKIHSEKTKTKTNNNRLQLKAQQNYSNKQQIKKNQPNLFKTFAEQPNNQVHLSHLIYNQQKLKGLPLKLRKSVSYKKNTKQPFFKSQNTQQSNFSSIQQSQFCKSNQIRSSLIESIIDSSIQNQNVMIVKNNKQRHLFDSLNQTTQSTDAMVQGKQLIVQQFEDLIKNPQKVKFVQLKQEIQNLSKQRDEFKIIEKLFCCQKSKLVTKNSKVPILNEGIRLFSNCDHRELYLGNYSKIISELQNDQDQVEQIRQVSDRQTHQNYQLPEVQQQISVILNFNEDRNKIEEQKMIQIIKGKQIWINPQALLIRESNKSQNNLEFFIPKHEIEVNQLNRNDGKKVFIMIQKIQKNIQRLVSDKQSENQFIPNNKNNYKNNPTNADTILIGLVQLYNYLIDPEFDIKDKNMELLSIPINFQQFRPFETKAQLKRKIKQITQCCIMSLNKQLMVDTNCMNSVMKVFRQKFHQSLERVSWIQWIRVFLQLYKRVETQLS